MPQARSRSRPSKSMLGLDAVLAATMALVDELGCEAVSLRRVAQALETGPASLYVYVRDRQELMALVLDHAVADVVVPDEGAGDWRTRLELLVGRIVVALAGHNDIASVGLRDALPGPHGLRLTEETARLLRAGGLDDDACSWAIDLLGQYIYSTALEHAGDPQPRRAPAPPSPDADPTGPETFTARLDATFRALPAEQYPTLRALAPRLTGGDPNARAAWKLRVIIDGLLAQPPLRAAPHRDDTAAPTPI
ncbi:TetR/AcrR family transcriptional regulator C-terminal domain-containing protein (plasmid) [Embleya sp. NBC_00888]|uniref:TetR/AcrR family transcriptional regulator C-terminal domain-containing protein n=1 Tax=Embleya sp. NBC_00888 TaxID=2975960 RepID=UPI002F90CCB2|nr:TetR/AcrR family transcriptional regulator C-terminal domain-containing protein [Embleya sp. NBC_00888]